MIALTLLICALNVHAEDELSFDEALSQIVEQHVDVQVQQTKINIAEQNIVAARARFSPHLGLKFEQGRTGGNGPTPAASSAYGFTKSYAATAKLNVFSFGADWAALRAAYRDHNQEQSTYADTALTAEERGARVLLDFIERKQAVEAYRRSADASRHFLEIAEARFAKGLLSREETDKISLDAANAEARRADAEFAFNQSRAELEGLLGHSRLRAEWPWTASLNAEAVKDLLTESDAAAERALNERPDVRAARQSIEAQDYRQRSSYRSMLPTLDLSYSVGETETHGLLAAEWSTLATFTVPLWDGLRDRAAYRIDVEKKYAAEIRLRQLQRDVKARLRAAQANLRISLQQYEVRQRNLKTARHILQQDEARLKAGRASANELTVDVARVTEAELLALEGLRQAHLNYVLLNHEFGQRVR